MVHLRHQTTQGESVDKPETHLNFVCKYDIKEVHDNYSNPRFSKKVHVQKHPWGWTNVERVAHTSYYKY